jgi:osmotically-inducible protein OsmY
MRRIVNTHDPNRRGPHVKTDVQIQKEVRDELIWDGRVEVTDVGIQVDAGVVGLTGTVSSYPKRLAAQEAAHRVGGVLDVVNDIKVHVPGSLQRTDIEIAQAVRDALEWDVVVPDRQIRSTVSGGWVTLEGVVPAWRDREIVERAVHALAGVVGVTNKIDVNAPYVKTERIQREIEEALERRAERHARHVRVVVRGGTVELSGPVQSWAEREAVLGAARYTHGVKQVEDHLQLQPFE